MHQRPPAASFEVYTRQTWYEKEQDLLLSKLWQFFTFASLVNKPNSFVTKTLCGISVVVQNFNGELKAFENICLHRQAPLQSEAHGCRPLTCVYHGWNYGADGKVSAIPFDEFYQFSPQQRSGMCLKSFAVRKIGGLIFINTSSDPLPIERQFSESFLSSLTEVTTQFDYEVITTTLLQRRFNWKLVFENLRDGLHASFLHRGSLSKFVSFRPWMPDEKVWQSYLMERSHPASDAFDEVRKYFSKGGPDAALDRIDPQSWHKKVERYKADDNYYNWLAFPTLHIASTAGYSFTLEHYLPRSADTTDVEIYFVLARRKESIPEIKPVLYELLQSTTRILAEDIGILEQIQATMHEKTKPSHWGAYELRSHRIATWITEVVGGRIVI